METRLRIDSNHSQPLLEGKAIFLHPRDIFLRLKTIVGLNDSTVEMSGSLAKVCVACLDAAMSYY